MKIIKRKLNGVYEIFLEPNYDSRGFFMRSYDKAIFKQYHIDKEWINENHSFTKNKGTIRGLHFQLPPFSETKLIRCIRGSFLDVFVDLRKGSSTFGKWDSIELTDEKKNLVYIPKGFAHGFCTLSELSEAVYKVDSVYSKESERGIIWNDKSLNISWPISDPILSNKDLSNITFHEFLEKYEGL